MPWNNPIGLAAATALVTSGGGRAVQNYGDAIWDEITARQTFTVRDVAQVLAHEFNLSLYTARDYVRAFIAYAQAAPEEFSGPASCITRKAPRLWTLTDNPER